MQHGLSERANVPYNPNAGTLQLTAVRINGEPLANQNTSGTPSPQRADITLQSKGNLTLADVAIQGKDLKLISTDGNLTITGSSEHQEWSGNNEQHVRDIAHASTLKGDTISLSAGRLSTKKSGEQSAESSAEPSSNQTAAVRGDIRLQHVELDSTGLTQMRASGDITVDPGSSYSYDHSTTSTKSGWLIKKTTTTEHTRESTTVNASHLNAGTLDIQAQGDITFTATELSTSTGTANVRASGAIHYLAAHNQNFASDTSQSSSSFLGLIKVGSSSDSHTSKTRTALVTSVQSEGDVLSDSQGGDTTLAGTRIRSAHGTVTLLSQHDLVIQNVHNTSEVDEQHRSSSLNLFSGKDLLSNTKTADGHTETHSTVVGASVTGAVVNVIAKNTITVTGSSVIGETATTLQAGNNLIIESAQDTHTSSQAHTRSQSGFMLSGLADGNPTIDLKRSQSSGNSVETSTQVASTIGSNQGDTTLTAQEGLLAVVGSHLNAGTDKTLKLQGAGLLLTGALNTETSTREHSQRSTNLALNGLAEASKGPDQRTQDATSTTITTLAPTTLSGHTITLTATGTPGSGTALDDKGNSVSYTLPSGITLAGTQITLTPGAGAGAGAGPGSLSLDAGAGALHLDLLVSTNTTTTTHLGRDLAYQKVHNQGSTTQSAHYNQIELNGGTLQTKAEGGTVVQIGQVLATSGKAPSAALFNPDPSQVAPPHEPSPLANTSAGLQASLAALAQQPGMAYVQQLTTRDPVTGGPRLDAAQWQAVDLAVDQWDYKKQGLTPEGAIIVAAVVSYFTAGAASGASTSLVTSAGMTTTTTTVAATATTAATSTVALSTAGTIVSNALAGAMASLAGQAAVSLINNQGNIGATLRDLGSKETVRGLVSSMVTAGVVSGLNEVFSANGINIDLNAGAKAGFGVQLQANLIKGVVGAGVNSAINGTSYREGFERAIVSGIVNTIGAQAANTIGDAASGSTDPATGTYTPARIDAFAQGVAHAVLGCALGAANAAQGGTNTGGGCGAGALGAVVGELSAGFIDGSGPDATLRVGNFAKLMSVTAVALAGGDTAQMNIAATTGENAALNNRQLHPDERTLARRLAARSEGKYTVQQIEDALRSSGNATRGESIAKGLVVDSSDPSAIYDKGAVWNAGSNGTLVQQLPNGGRVDADLAAFITANTSNASGNSPYAWSAGSGASAAPRTAWTSNGPVLIESGDKPLQHANATANGQTFSLPVADCPAASCTNGSPIAWASTDPNDQIVLAAYKEAVDQQNGKAAVTGGLIVGTAATLPVTWLGITLGGGIVGGGSNAAGQLIDGNPIDFSQVGLATGEGALIAAGTFGVIKGVAVIDGALSGTAGGVVGGTVAKTAGAVDETVGVNSGVTAYRVEGTTNQRVLINELGEVSLVPGRDQVVWINFGQDGRATQYLQTKIDKGLPGAELKSFEVDSAFLERIRSQAVPEKFARQNPNSPIISSDPYPDQYGIPKSYFDDLLKSIKQGTGKSGQQN